MEKKEIKDACEKAIKCIVDAEAVLKMVREDCKHEETFEGLWSWRIGSTLPATICSICGGLVQLHLPK